jgi:NhaA family Na+:H+ antiporter
MSGYEKRKTAMKTRISQDVLSGFALAFAALLALAVANSPFSDTYNVILKAHAGVLPPALDLSVQHWINDGLMAVFFFMIGLEIKREFRVGHLSSWSSRVLPFAAAVGGMAAPVLVYLIINRDSPETQAGWAIPAATDIAFALSVLALLASRIPVSLKVLLTAIAVIDDLGAILIIGLFYSQNLNLEPLLLASAAMVVMVGLNRAGVTRVAPYAAAAALLWFGVMGSGIHATLAGVTAALFIPLSAVEKLEHKLHPWVIFIILPVFAFANAGVSFEGITLASLTEPLTLGILLGLLIGKQLGIFAVIGLMVRLKLAPMPEGAGWGHLYGVALLCGVGFTMSLFIGGLAFPNGTYDAGVRMGVLVASMASGVLGYAILRACSRPKA